MVRQGLLCFGSRDGSLLNFDTDANVIGDLIKGDQVCVF